MATATVPQLDKFLVRNNTAGYIGVVKLDHRGEEHGENIEPYGMTWLSEAEMMLTARAPRDPKDNPFEEWELWFEDPQTGAKAPVKVRPLTLVKDGDRYTPEADRYVPTPTAPLQSAPASVATAARGETPAATPASSGAQTLAPPPPAAPASPQGAPMPATRTVPTATPRTAPAEDGQSWVAPPEAPGQIIPGSLGGLDGGGPDEAAAAPDPSFAPPASERFTPSVVGAQAVPQTPGAVEEERAERVDPQVGEETGAARPPASPPVEGEYAAREEVGSPESPATNGPPLVGE